MSLLGLCHLAGQLLQQLLVSIFSFLKHLKLASDRKDKYAIYDIEITNAIYESLELFNKYYNTMD